MEQILGRARPQESGTSVLLGADLDPFTMACLERLGARAGWRCLAACARGGPLVEWLRHRVGPGGCVVAVGPGAGEVGAMDAFDLAWARGAAADG